MIAGTLAGFFYGAHVALRHVNERQVEYDQALEDHYIQSRTFTLLTSAKTLAKAEDENIDGIMSDHQVFIRSAFMNLVELHRSGHYEAKDEEIRKSLKRAKDFMAARPEQFLNQTFYALSSVTESLDEPEPERDPESQRVTDFNRKQLQAAFDYVDSLSLPSERVKSTTNGHE